jgi:hypothetical protein
VSGDAGGVAVGGRLIRRRGWPLRAAPGQGCARRAEVPGSLENGRFRCAVSPGDCAAVQIGDRLVSRLHEIERGVRPVRLFIIFGTDAFPMSEVVPQWPNLRPKDFGLLARQQATSPSLTDERAQSSRISLLAGGGHASTQARLQRLKGLFSGRLRVLVCEVGVDKQNPRELQQTCHPIGHACQWTVRDPQRRTVRFARWRTSGFPSGRVICPAWVGQVSATTPLPLVASERRWLSPAVTTT